jgi:DNA primase
MGGTVDAVEEIKGRLSIEDVVSRTVELRRSGASLKGLCPFHEERTPSFYVSPSRGTFHCFGCGKGGDIFSFVMESQRTTFPEALNELAEQAGVTLPAREQQKPSLKNRLYEANEVAARFFSELLVSGQGERARRYLENRHFGRDAIDSFSLGYAPNGRDGLLQALHRAGFDDRIALAAGLARQDDSGTKSRDQFRGRLMFPIRDAAGHILGFGARALEEDQQPKYLNSPQTEIFDKSTVVFGVHLAAEGIRHTRQAVLVEGYLDAIRAHVAGYSNVVASLGTAVTSKQLSVLDRLTDEIVLALDPDPAGQNAAARTSLSALAEFKQTRSRGSDSTSKLDLRIARLPEDSGDPDELIRERPEVWENSIKTAVPAFEFYFAQTMGSLDRSTDAWREEAINRLMPPIRQLSESAAWQATWIQRLANETQIDPQLLLRSMPSGRTPSGRGRPREASGLGAVVQDTTTKGMSLDSVESKERSLLALLLKIVVIPDEAYQQLKDVRLRRMEHQSILQALLDWRPSMNYDYEFLREEMTEDVAIYADDLRTQNEPLPNDDKLSVAVDLHLARIRQANLDAQHRRATKLLEDMAPEDREGAIANLAELMSARYSLDQHLRQLDVRSGQSHRV